MIAAAFSEISATALSISAISSAPFEAVFVYAARNSMSSFIDSIEVEDGI